MTKPGTPSPDHDPEPSPAVQTVGQRATEWVSSGEARKELRGRLRRETAEGIALDLIRTWDSAQDDLRRWQEKATELQRQIAEAERQLTSVTSAMTEVRYQQAIIERIMLCGLVEIADPMNRTTVAEVTAGMTENLG